jgi:hypothetical protein
MSLRHAADTEHWHSDMLLIYAADIEAWHAAEICLRCRTLTCCVSWPGCLQNFETAADLAKKAYKQDIVDLLEEHAQKAAPVTQVRRAVQECLIALRAGVGDLIRSIARNVVHHH